VGTDLLEWSLVIDYTPHMLPPGDYEVIPYLLVRQRNIPSDLLDNLGEEIEDFDPAYLLYPVKRSGGRLRIERID